MRLIKDVIKLFSKTDNNKTFLLSETQKKKYSKQYTSIMIPTALIMLVLIGSITKCIIYFFEFLDITYIGLN